MLLSFLKNSIEKFTNNITVKTKKCIEEKLKETHQDVKSGHFLWTYIHGWLFSSNFGKISVMSCYFIQTTGINIAWFLCYMYFSAL